MHTEIDTGESDQQRHRYRAGPRKPPVEPGPSRLDEHLGERQIEAERYKGVPAGKAKRIRAGIVEVRVGTDAVKGQLHGLVEYVGAQHGDSEERGFPAAILARQVEDDHCPEEPEEPSAAEGRDELQENCERWGGGGVDGVAEVRVELGDAVHEDGGRKPDEGEGREDGYDKIAGDGGTGHL